MPPLYPLNLSLAADIESAPKDTHSLPPQAAGQPERFSRTVHRMVDLGKQPLDLLPREGFRQGAPTPDKVTGLDRIASHELLVETKVKKMFQRIEPAVDRRPGAAMLMLHLHKLVDLAKGDLC